MPTAATVARTPVLAQPDTPDTPAALLSAGFPDPEGVRYALAWFARTPTWAGAEGRRLEVEVSAGTVGLRVYDPARSERSRTVTRGARPLRRDARQSVHNGSPSTDVRWSRADAASPHVSTVTYGVGAWLNVTDPGFRERTVTRVVSEWSRRSRARMVRTFAELDYRPLFVQGVPAMLTLTYPRCWLSVAPGGDAAKAHLDRLRKRWERRYGVPMVALWKLEFQHRAPGKRCDCHPADDGRAPHFHLFAVPPARDADGAPVSPLAFRAWLSDAWADVVGSADPRHRRAGTAVDYAEGARMRDPKRLAVYFLKHGTKTGDGKEYQHQVPSAWRTVETRPGRFWGHWHLDSTRRAVAVPVELVVPARRLLRRWSRAQGRTRRVRVWRNPVDRAPFCDDHGEVLYGARPRQRRVTRRSYSLGHAGLVGGWVTANNAPSLAVALAQYLDTQTCESPPERLRRAPALALV